MTALKLRILFDGAMIGPGKAALLEGIAATGYRCVINTGADGGQTVGHVHLHVGDINRASDFYSTALGFDRMVWRYPGALFLAAGGYHHHLGTNTWAQGAASPTERDAQLLEWTIVTPDAEAALDSVAAAGFTRDGSLVRDPWGTAVRLVSAP